MAKITVKDAIIRTLKVNDIDYICITDIARQKNPLEPKDVVKNWLRSKNTLEYLGLWEMLNNPDFKGIEFDPFYLENLNAVFIQKGMEQSERLTELNKIAIQQMKVLEAVEDRKLLK